MDFCNIDGPNWLYFFEKKASKLSISLCMFKEQRRTYIISGFFFCLKMVVDPIFAFQGQKYKDFCNIDGRDWLYFLRKKRSLLCVAQLCTE